MQDDALNKQLIQEVTNKWWLVLLRGIVMLLLGIFLIVYTEITITAVILILGVYWLINGLLDTYRAVSGWKQVPDHYLLLTGGLLQLIVGAIIVVWPFFTASFLTNFTMILIAIVALLAGVIALVRGVRVRQQIHNRWTLFVGGIMAILYGVLVLFNPSFPSTQILAMVMGTVSIIGGFLVILFAFRLRQVGQRLGDL